MPTQRVERRLAAILAADVAGYSRLIGIDEEGTLARLRSLRRELIDPKIAEHKGRIVKTAGDGLLMEFASVVDALRCAAEVQQAMTPRNAGEAAERRIEFRVGIHQGDIVVEDGDIFGDGVNIAARLEGLAEPGGICVSRRVQEDAAGRLDLAFEDMGEQALKNIARPVQVYRVVAPLTPTISPQAGRGSRGAAAAGEGQQPVSDAPALALPDKPSIAVLPFQNMSGDPEQEYFADGMVEEIITALSRIRWLFVIARNSSFTYKGQAIDVKRVGRELGVRYVLEGSVRKAGNRVRITGQLIDTTSGAHLWANRFDGNLDDIFELQDQVASSVAGVIEPTLRQSELDRAGRKPTESLDAYDLYLRALALRNEHSEVDAHMRSAIGLLKQALAIDPHYMPAAAAIGWCRVHQSGHGRAVVSEAEIAEAVALARRVIEVEKDDPDPLWMAGFTLLSLAGERDIAASAIERALTINPNSALAWMARGFAYNAQGQTASAIEACTHAMRLSPLDHLRRAFTLGIAAAHLRERRYEEALEWAERTLRDEPGYRAALRLKVVACAHLDRIEEARAALRQWLEIQPQQTVASNRAFILRIAAPEVAQAYAEGLRKAGLPEE